MDPKLEKDLKTVVKPVAFIFRVIGWTIAGVVLLYLLLSLFDNRKLSPEMDAPTTSLYSTQQEVFYESYSLGEVWRASTLALKGVWRTFLSDEKRGILQAVHGNGRTSVTVRIMEGKNGVRLICSVYREVPLHSKSVSVSPQDILTRISKRLKKDND